MPTFSVLIPAYNAEAYIAECVESVIKQNDVTFEDIEIIIANDGSFDATREICDGLAERYSSIRVFHKENEGQLLTRRFLIEKASGEYVLFLDADDKWEDTLLKTLKGYIKEYNRPDIISFGFNTWFGENYSVYKQMEKILFCDNTNMKKAWKLLLCKDTYNSVCLKVIKRTVLTRATIKKSLENIRRGEDKLQMIACLEIAENILFIPEYLYDYRVDNVSMTRSFNPEYFWEILTVDAVAIKKIEEHLSSKKEYLKPWAKNLINKYYDYIAGAARSKLSDKSIKEWLMKYKKHSLMQNALGYSKHSIKALLIRLNLFEILLWYYRR